MSEKKMGRETRTSIDLFGLAATPAGVFIVGLAPPPAGSLIGAAFIEEIDEKD
jgi:hypothetical protein